MIPLLLTNLEALFAWLLAASWQASVLALFVLLLQRLLGAHLNPRWRYALWLLVLLRLVLPALPESALSLFQFAPPPPAALEVSVTEPLFSSPPPALPAHDPILSPAPPAAPFTFYSLLALVWFSGAIALLILTWVVNHRFAQQVARAPAISDPQLLRLFAEARAELRIRRPIRLIESARIQSPAIMGLFTPTLLLPVDVGTRFDPRELRFIFLHELAHLKRGDVFVQALIALLQILHWFNPVLWYAFRRMRIDREPATDALVLSRVGEAEKERYGLMLIKLLEHFNQRHSLTTLVGILEDKGQFKRRFGLIARFTRGAYGWSLLGVLLIGLLAVFCLTKSKSTPPPSPEPPVRIEFAVAGQTFSLPEAAVKQTAQLLQELLVNRYINGTPDDVFHWQRLQDTSVSAIKNSGSYLHVIYGQRPTIPIGKDYSVQPKEVWIGLLDNTSGDTYPGYPGGLLVISDGKDGTYNLIFGSKSLLTGIGLNRDVYAHLSDPMKKSLDANQSAYQNYLDWTAHKDATGVSINQQIVTAVQAGDLPTLQKLAAQGVDVTKVKGDGGATLLFNAASPQVAEFLIQHGIDVNARNARGYTALDSISMSPTKEAADTATVLLQHGADPNAVQGESKMTPVMSAYAAATIDTLVKYGANLNAKDADGNSALSMAGSKPVEHLEALLKHGVVFNPKTDGPTMLMSASWMDNVPMVTWLLNHGVDPNLPGVWSKRNGKPITMLPMQAAAVSGHPRTAKLLLQHGAKAEDQMITALHNGHDQFVKLLWENGVRNISPLLYAVSQGAPVGDLQKLLDHGTPADPPQDTRLTPLGDAAKLGNMDAVKLLIAHHADVNAGAPVNSTFPKQNRMSPLWLAAGEGQDEVVAYLLQHGAVPDPSALEQAAENSYPYSEQRTNDHFEKTVRILLDAGAAKSAKPDMVGMILAAPIQTRQGPPNAAVLKMLLDAGLSPEAPMPYIVDNGEKPNSVIGYFRDYYQKYKDDPANGNQAAAIKPLLDLLEAADASAPKSETTTQPANPQAAPPNDAAPKVTFQAAGKPVELSAETQQKIIQRLETAVTKAGMSSGPHPWPNRDSAENSPPDNFQVISDPHPRVIPDPAENNTPETIEATGSYFRVSYPQPKSFHSSAGPLLLTDLYLGIWPGQSKIAGHGGWLCAVSSAHQLYFFAYLAGLHAAGREKDDLFSDPEIGPCLIQVFQKAHLADTAVNPALGSGSSAGNLSATTTTVTTDPSLPASAQPTNFVRVATKILLISEDDYQAHRSEIDAAALKGDIEPLSRLKSFHLLSEPAVLTKSGERGVLEAVRVLPYAVDFTKDTSGKMIPTEFARQNLGVRFVVQPTINEDKIDFKGDLQVSSLAGWTQAGDGTSRPNFHLREAPVAETFASGQTKGFQMPGGPQLEPIDPGFAFDPKTNPDSSKNPKIYGRLFYFITTTAQKGALDANSSPSAPADDTATSTVRTFLIPPGFFKTNTPGSDDARAELVARGITLPVNATVTLLPGGKLVIRSTPDILDQIQALLDRPVLTGFVAPDPAQPLNASLGGPSTNLSLKLQPAAFSLGTAGLVVPASDTATTSSPAAAKDLDALKKELLSAQEDADARHVLLNSVQDLPDDKFLATLTALGRSQTGGDYASLQKEIANRQTAIESLRKSGLAEDNPLVVAALAKLEERQKQIGELIAGMRRAMTIDAQMADARVSNLRKQLASASASPVAASPVPDLKEQLKNAEQDTSARHVLFDKVQNLPDDQFLATLSAMGRTDPTASRLQREIADKDAALLALTRAGKAADDPDVKALQAQVDNLLSQLSQITAAIRTAMAVDLKMADSRVALLQNQLGATGAANSPSSPTPASPQVRLELKVSEIDDDVYLANQDKIDTALKKDGVAVLTFINNLKGVSLLSAPIVTTVPGLKATIDIVRAFPYPVSFDPAENVKGANASLIIPPTPREFVTRNVGISADIIPTLYAGKVETSCALRITGFDGFTETNQLGKMPAFNTREVNLVEEFTKDDLVKGALIPGLRYDNETNTNHDDTGKVTSTTQKIVKKRLLVFLSARLVPPDGAPTSAAH